MVSKRRLIAIALLSGLAAANGCCHRRDKFAFCKDDICHIPSAPNTCGPQQIHLASAKLCNDCGTGTPEAFSPSDIDESSLSPDRMLGMSLEDCVQFALANSKVIRDLGGTVLRAPQAMGSTLDPALQFSDPRVGEEAALAAFDANLFASSYFDSNKRRFNNAFFGNGGFSEQSLSTTQIGVNKISATGALFSFRNVTIGDNNNQTGNALGRQSWENYYEAQIRQPLLQGAGTEFNRIAGPGASPGVLNGVLLARTKTDQTLVEFEKSVRDLVADVENSYWDLYYAYRDLEAKIQIRDIAASTLQGVADRDGTAGDRAQAEEQLHRFQADVIDALNGRPIDGTRTQNGSAGGTFRPNGGVRVAERKLRLIIGMPINDGRLLHAIDSPPVSPVIYDWSSAIGEAIMNREELRKQRWVVKQKELELIANKNFLRPQLDLVSTYRYRGFGNDLFGDYSPANPAERESFYDGQLQDWQFGMEYNIPVGLRRAYAAVRNSRLAIAKEIEVLREQERVVHYGLSNAMNESKRAYESMLLQQKRLESIVTQLNALEAKREADEKPELDVVLETHRRLLDARLRFHQSQVEYALSLRNVHFEKGTLLSYNNVSLVESETPPGADRMAANRLSRQDSSVKPATRDVIVQQ